MVVIRVMLQYFHANLGGLQPTPRREKQHNCEQMCSGSFHGPNVEMIRANDGATRAPHEACLRKAPTASEVTQYADPANNLAITDVFMRDNNRIAPKTAKNRYGTNATGTAM